MTGAGVPVRAASGGDRLGRRGAPFDGGRDDRRERDGAEPIADLRRLGTATFVERDIPAGGR